MSSTRAQNVDPKNWVLEHTTTAPSKASIVAIGGDGVGKEVVDAAIRCLQALDLPLEIKSPVHGLLAEQAGLDPFSAELRSSMESCDAVLFGAVDTGPNGRCRPILRHLRFGLQCYANVRPAFNVEGIPCKLGDGNTNLVVVRELSEGMYPGCEGSLEELATRWPELRDRIGKELPRDGVFALRVTTEGASRRIGRYAAKLSKQRRDNGIGDGCVTIVGKDNVLKQSGGLFHQSIEEEVVAEGLETRYLHVDDAAHKLVAKSEMFDVVVTTNLFGDILSDIAAEAFGGMGLAPSAGIGEGVAYFEPCHGSAPDIAGQGVANPAAAILSAAQMLAYLGFGAGGHRLTEALFRTIRNGSHTADLGGTLSTTAFTDDVLRTLETPDKNKS